MGEEFRDISWAQNEYHRKTGNDYIIVHLKTNNSNKTIKKWTLLYENEVMFYTTNEFYRHFLMKYSERAEARDFTFIKKYNRYFLLHKNHKVFEG